MPTLDWLGKKAVLNHHREVPFRLLKNDPELSAGDQESGNLLVQGDNLLALKALLPYYAGRVKCIYIDPPYNTGNENWAYNDAVNGPEMKKWLGAVVGRDDLSRHDKWLCMMYPRLSLLRQFLRQDGVIFISIDDNEAHNLRLLMDEIFGSQNFISTFVWQKRASPDNDETFATAIHDYIICYSKNRQKCNFNRLPRTEEMDARYENPDNDSRGPWTSSDLTRREYREHDYYPIRLPSGREVLPAAGRSWSIPRENFQALVEDNRIWFGPRGDSMPRRKRFLTEVSTGIVPTTWWPKDTFGDNQMAKRDLRQILFEVADLFPTPKPVPLLEKIFQIATNPGDLVLDSFAGSGTTGHAVIAMNKAAGEAPKRRFILIEMDSAICRDVTAERIRRVILGYENSKEAKKAPIKGLGGGFQYCVLDAPLFDESGKIEKRVTFADLAHHVFFAETGSPLAKKPDGKKTPLIGVFQGTAFYLLFNGILGDRSVNGGNVLTSAVLAALPSHNGPRVIFGEGCRLGPDRLKRENITFRQIPYDIKVT